MLVDPTTLAVLQGWLEQIANEMDMALVHSAFSTIISEQYDRACGIYDAHTGGTIVMGRTGLPMFVGCMQFCVAAVLDKAKQEPPQPGDIFMLNDPFIAGTHLHDVKLVRPFFYRGNLEAFLAATGHWVDIGSSHPGGWNPRATELIQEGIRIPLIRIYRQGQLNQEALELVMANLRLPRDASGDFQAQVSALQVGHDRLTQVFDKYGVATVRAALKELEARAEAHARALIQEIPDGTYTFTDYLDDDGIGEEPITLSLRLEVRGSDMHLDFSGSSPPTRGPYNCSAVNTMAVSFIALKHFFPDLPLNSGSFKPIAFTIPATTFLGARYPRASAGFIDISCRVMDVVLGALAQALPEKAVAAPFSSLPIFSVGGVNPDTGKYFVCNLFFGGGYGGSRESDGLINGALPVGLARMSNLEVMEQRFPILFHRLAIRENSGGPGKHCGGHALEAEIEVGAEEALASNLGDRMKFPPFGVLGGQPGKAAEIYLVQNGRRRRVFKETGIRLAKGDRIIMRYPGGGGYGDPLERDLSLIERDVARGYLSREDAAVQYQVAFEPGSRRIDSAQTARLRAKLKQNQGAP